MDKPSPLREGAAKLAKQTICRAGLRREQQLNCAVSETTGYYRRLINGLAKIVGPLHGLVNETDPQEPKEKDSHRVQPLGSQSGGTESMKWALATGPVLGYADYANIFMSERDASSDGLSTCPKNRVKDNAS